MTSDDKKYKQIVKEIVPDKLFPNKVNTETEKRIVTAFQWLVDQNSNSTDKLCIEVLSKFNLIKEQGRFVTETPNVIFEIALSFINSDMKKFEERFIRMKELLLKQYLSEFKSFKGYDLTGSTSLSGSQYEINEKTFITKILQPAIKSYYFEKKREAWMFIRKELINFKVDKEHPDFLNRTVIPVIVNRYKSKSKSVSEEALDFLEKFILDRNLIPSKASLVHQECLKQNLSKIKLHKIISISLKEYGVPIDLFIERICLSLIETKKYRDIYLPQIKRWIKDGGYLEKFSRLHSDIHNIVRKMVEVDRVEGIEIFRNMVKSGLIDKLDKFDIANYSQILKTIYKEDFKSGKTIFQNIVNNKSSSDNLQLLTLRSIVSKPNENIIDEKILLMIYRVLVKPLLNDFSCSSEKISQRFSDGYSRQAFLEFAESIVDRLPNTLRIKMALEIVRAFIDDPDPYLPGQNKSDPKDKYNEHKQIEEGKEPHSVSSVRGYCGWVLAECAILDGREYIPTVIDYTEELIRDENYFVKYLASFALKQLARNRLTVMPKDKDTLFFGNDVKKALELSKRVENLAFEFLEEISNKSDNVKKALTPSILQVFNYIRILNEKDAKRLINLLQKFPEESIGEAAILFIYFAEFRKDSYRGWKWSKKGLYDDLDPFNDTYFKKVLNRLLTKKAPAAKRAFVYAFLNIVKEEESFTGKSIKYIRKLLKPYNSEVYGAIYHFIEEVIDLQAKESIELLKDIWKEEVRNIKQKDITPRYFFDSESVLKKVKENVSGKEYFDILRILLEYPRDHINVRYLGNAIKDLEKQESKEAKEIIQKYKGIATSQD